MLKRLWFIVFVTALCLPAQDKPAAAPSSTPRATYRLEYTISELEGGKKKESRSYTMLVEDGRQGRLRIGNRVPIPYKADQVQYMDVGVNIDARPFLVDANTLRLETTVEVSGAATTEPAAPGRPPMLRNMRNEATATLSPDKPLLLTSQDEPFSHTTFQVHVVARVVK